MGRDSGGTRRRFFQVVRAVQNIIEWPATERREDRVLVGGTVICELSGGL